MEITFCMATSTPSRSPMVMMRSLRVTWSHGGQEGSGVTRSLSKRLSGEATRAMSLRTNVARQGSEHLDGGVVGAFQVDLRSGKDEQRQDTVRGR